MYIIKKDEGEKKKQVFNKNEIIVKNFTQKLPYFLKYT